MSKDLTKKQEGEVAKYQQQSSMGNIQPTDLKLPRLVLLQALSPQVQNDPDHYKQGQYMNTLTQEIVDPVVFVPVFPFKNVICWKPRSEGGGMLWKSMDFADPTVRAAMTWNGTQKPTADVYVNVVCLVKGQDMPIVLSFTKTSLTAGFNLTTLMQLSGYNWKYQYELTSEKKKNDKGQYYVMRVKRLDLTTDDTAQAASELFETVKGMSIDTDYESERGEQPAGSPIQEGTSQDGL